MRRFRYAFKFSIYIRLEPCFFASKKSDGKRTVSVLTSDHEQNLEPLDVLPELPLTNDFRSSLILPECVHSFSIPLCRLFNDIFDLSLSRRFSLLRSVGDPSLLDQLRSRLADQRTRGAENQITEEEEEMFLDTLERIRPKNAQSTSPDTIDECETARNSIKSSPSSSVSSSPSSRSTKRYSNNLFGSGRLRDYTYLKTVASSRGSTSGSTRTASLTPTEASEKTVSLSGFRPVTPEASSNPSSVQSSPNEKGPIRSTPVVLSSPCGEQQLQAITAAEYRLHKTLGPSVLKRASMALDEAIREIEDEVEDEILLPRSVPAPRGSLEQPTAELVRQIFLLSNCSFF
jgi:serine/arginine repetitive matrix protein 2